MDVIWVFLLSSVVCGHYVSGQYTTIVVARKLSNVPTMTLDSVVRSDHTEPLPTSMSIVFSTPSPVVGSSPIGNHSVSPSMTLSPVNSTLFSANQSSIIPTPSPSVNVSSYNMSTSHIKPTMSVNTSSTSIVPTMTPTFSSYNMSTSHIKPTMSVNTSSTSVVPTMTPTLSPNVTITSVMPSSSVIPTSTPMPTTGPPYGNYTVKNSNGTACVLASFSIKFEVEYINMTSGKKATADFQLPKENSVVTSGSCPYESKEQQESSVSLSWPMGDPMYNFTMVFYTEKQGVKAGNVPEDSWSTKSVEISINTTDNNDFPDAKAQTITVSKTGPIDYLNAKFGHALLCRRKISISDLKNPDKTVSAKVTFDELEIQPFGVPHSGKFGEADDCENSPTPKPTPTPKPKSNTVAIAVGCTLGGLVLIVLIGYLIARRRGRANASAGYRKL